MEAALTAIAAWLSFNFMLPPVYRHPRIEFVSADADDAFYDDATRTIYLAGGWTGASAAELSVLVREMAHHMQSAAGPKYASRAEREKLAHIAQRHWLAVFGGNLMEEFRLDPVALVVRTNCTG